jgi:amino acid transporter
MAQTGSLRRNALGVAAITFFVVSAAAPLTAVAGGYPIAMLFGNGSGVPAAVVLVTILLLIFSVGYTTMARHISNAGSFFAFTARGLGGVAGGAAAYMAVLAYNAMQIGLYGLFGAVTAQVLSGLPEIGPFFAGMPWWGWALLGMALVGIFGYLKIDLSAIVLAVLVCIEYVIVLILDFAIISAGGDSGNTMVSFTSDAFFQGSPVIGLLLCFAAFMGFEATTIYSEEAKEPGRTVPRATYLSVLIIGVFYAVTTWCMVNGEGADKVLPTLQGLQDPAAFVFILSERYVGLLHSQVMGLLLISSVFAALLAFHNAAARYFYVLGREGLLPAHLGQTHGEHQSPHLGSVLQTVLAFFVLGIFIVAGQDPFLAVFAWLTNLATLSVITLMALVSFAVVAFFRKRPELSPSILKTMVAPLVAGILLGIIALLVVKNFPILTGANEAIAYILVALVPIAALGGAVVANQLKHQSGARFAELGAHQAE